MEQTQNTPDPPKNKKSLSFIELWFANRWFGIFSSFAAIFLSIIVGSLFLLFYGYSPFEVYTGLLIGALGSPTAIAETLLKATPLLFTGLAVSVAFQSGLFNIGGEGQLVIGALAAAMVGLMDWGLPSIPHVILALGAGTIFGAVWGGIAGFIKARFGAHEVIVTIMMNYIALLLTSYMVNYPWKAEGMVPQTDPIQPGAQLLRIMTGSQLSIGLIIGIFVVVVSYLILRRTILGLELRAVGLNSSAAETGGINTILISIVTMALAGGLAGLGGGVEILGVHRRFIQGFSPGFGYDGIAVSVLANNQPHLIPLTAFLFAVIRAGGAYLDRTTGLPGDFSLVIQGLVIFFAASPRIVAYLLRKKD
jgi:general nucleoside transport system permease protein